jgi:hypothetical protein
MIGANIDSSLAADVVGSCGQAHKPSSMSSHARLVVVDRPLTIRDICCMISYTHMCCIHTPGLALGSVSRGCVCVGAFVLYCILWVCHDQYIAHGLNQSAEFVHHE